MNISISTLFGRPLVGVALLGLICSAPLASAAEDQWYDPTDWFDGNNIESDDTYGLYDYDYDYDYDTDWDRYGTWGDETWNSDYYDSQYWDKYDWDSDTTVAGTSGSTSSSTTAGSSSQQKSGSSSTTKSGSSAQDAVVYTYVLIAEPISSAQQGKSSGKQSSSSGQTASQSGDKKGSQQIARLNGTIEGLKQMTLKRQSGAAGPHTVAKIKLENGKSTIVSLGRSSQLEKLNLKKGDKIQAVGRKGMIDGETVFVANSFKAKGQTIAANPAIRLNESQMSKSQSAQSQTAQGQSAAQGQSKQQAGAMTGSRSSQGQTTLTGKVESVSRASAGQGKNQHTLVNIKLADGKSSTVDFGPAASLEKIGLDEGDNITVRGHKRQVNGREVLVADLLKVDGEKVSSVSR